MLKQRKHRLGFGFAQFVPARFKLRSSLVKLRQPIFRWAESKLWYSLTT